MRVKRARLTTATAKATEKLHNTIVESSFHKLCDADEDKDEVIALATVMVTQIMGHLCGYLNHECGETPEEAKQTVGEIFTVIFRSVGDVSNIMTEEQGG